MILTDLSFGIVWCRTCASAFKGPRLSAWVKEWLKEHEIL